MMCFFSLYCIRFLFCFFFFFFNDTATTEIYTLSLHERSSDLEEMRGRYYGVGMGVIPRGERTVVMASYVGSPAFRAGIRDRKSTRLNSSHLVISYAVFCLKKKKKLCILIRIDKCVHTYALATT